MFDDINFSEKQDVTELCNIMNKYGSDKGSPNRKSHTYTTFYHHIFKNIRYEKIRLFEMGIGTLDINFKNHMNEECKSGGSLRGWAEYFPNANIYGADIDKNVLFEELRIKTYYCDQTNSEIIQQMWQNVDLQENFDIIIDDGYHNLDANLCLFNNSIYKLNKNGFYIIEDVTKKNMNNYDKLTNAIKQNFPNMTVKLIKIYSVGNWNDSQIIVIYNGLINEKNTTNIINNKFDNLINWIKSNGGFISDKLSIKQHDDANRYIYANEFIDIDIKLFDIPKICCITEDTYKKISNKNSDNKILYSLLYHLRLGEQSFYYPYLNLFPKANEFTYHPLMQYNQTNRDKWINISEKFIKILDAHEKKINDIIEEFKTFDNVEQKYINYDNIKYCYLLCITRQWGYGLVPFADLLQHSIVSNMFLSIDNDMANMTTKEHILQYSTVYDNYGLKDDLSMLIAYGFIEDIDNKFLIRYLPINLTINYSNNTMLNTIKEIICKKISDKQIFYFNNKNIQNELIYLLRVLCLSEQDYKFIDINTEFYKNFISIDNESIVYNKILELIYNQECNFNIKEIENAVNIVKNNDNNSIDYRLAKTVLFNVQIIHNNYMFLFLLWNQILQNPFETCIVFDKYSKYIVDF